MKLILTVGIFVFATSLAQGQVETGDMEYLKFWSETDSVFASEEISPLKKEDLSSFDSVPRFAFDPSYRVEALWTGVKRQKPEKFDTSTDRKATYQKVGVINFKLNGDSLELSAYQNLDYLRKPGAKPYVFIPFTDDSNGEETYGGGRYIDMDVPTQDTIVVDFNLVYNPYCAYSDRYSCPVPPRENYIKTKVLAGARNPNDH